MAESTGKKEPAKRAASGKKPAPKPKKQPTAKQRKPQLPSLATARGWVGLKIDGLGNRTLGRVAGLLVDVGDGRPRWVIIRLGPMAGCTAVPFEHVAAGADRLWTAYERDWVRRAPRFKQNEALAAGEEMELAAHWGIRPERGRPAEVGALDEDEITAVPDEG